MTEAEMLPLDSILVHVINGGSQLFHWESLTRDTIREQIPELLPWLNISVSTWRVLAWVGIVGCGVVVIVTFCMLRSIRASIVIMQQASKVITHLPSILV